MIEIRFHGRGGQGVVTASEILAVSVFKDGNYCQAFPNFGPERAGAPVESYCRVDKKPILIRTHVDKPDFVVLFDPLLPKYVSVTKELKEDGILIINSKNKINKNIKQFVVNATDIALETLGKPIVNTAMLGALVKAIGIVKLNTVLDVVRERFVGDLGERNAKAVEKAYKETEEV